MRRNEDRNEGLGRFLSLVLRHHPESIGVTLDRFGYADVQELILQMNRHGRRIDFDTLKSIVETNDKQRYSFSSDYTKVRANQGHSIPVDLQLVERVPPDVLYHGTATRFLGSILDGASVGSRGSTYTCLRTSTPLLRSAGATERLPY
jgi:putative RNA 2'-phosphotransferase